ncbi:MucBP domain-containing protein [Enterococcus sp. DIV0840c]|uniref:MucBP domain-containing protein n=1 Tax=Enterococcus sp. DIV0840c TaxID=2774772 RepID=UPI003D2C97B6
MFSMGKYGRILLIGCLLLGQAPPITVVSAESVPEETSINQDRVGSEEEQVSSTSSENDGDTTSSTESSSSSNTDSRESSQTEYSESIESTDSFNDSLESSQDEENATNEQRAEILAENIASGTFGSSDWYITNEGILHIGSGTFGKLSSNTNPWRTFSNQIVKIVIDEDVIANSNSSYLFSLLNRVVEFEGLENLNTSNVTSMIYMFSNMSSLTSINVSNFDTSRVREMSNMFAGTTNLQSLDVSNFDTSNVTQMASMFQGMSSVGNLDLSNFQTNRVRFFQRMFSGMSSLETLNLSSFNTNAGSFMDGTFENLPALKIIELGTGFTFLTNAIFPEAPINNQYTGYWINVGSGTSEEPKGLNVWTASELVDNFSGDADADTYVWQPRVEGADVTIKFVDSENNTISEPTILSGKVGLPYDSEPKEIPGWYVVETPDNASGTFSEEAQEVLYVYERSDAAPVTVKYQDSEGNQLAEPSILSGKVGLPYDSDPKEIPGWYVVETPDNASGTFSEEAQEVLYVYERSDAAPVTVKYQDSEGNQLAEPSILSGKVGLPYDSEPKEIPGWYVVETPSNASGIFTEDPQEVVYVYERSDAAPVTVKYQDSEGNQLAEPSILSGKVGLPYDSEPKEIPGWYVVETPSNASGIFTEDPQEVVYVYERSDAAPVTVRYQDSEGNQLAEPSILSGKVGLPYESEAEEIPGWYVVRTPDNASGTFTEDPQEVVYVYDRSNAAPVTVRYVDTEGNQLSEPSILSGKVGLPYESEAEEIPGWYVIETPDNASGTFTENPQEVVYVYDRSDAAPVTVKYQDSEGNQLAEPSILSGKVGLPYESEAKEIPGWYVIETPDNASGTFTEEAQEVVYVYERSDAAPVTVKYRDSEGNQLAEPSILSGKVGLPYESEAKEIPGWYVIETPDNASGTFTEDPQEVVYVYERSDAAPVTVKYRDSEGNQLAEPSILSGKVGLPYESEAKEIPGWYVIETPDNASGTFTEEAQEVVYVYERSDAAPVTVKYRDSEGNQLAEPSILSGKVGLPYESEAKEIPGWHVTATPDNSSGIFTEEPQEVVYIYEINKIDSDQDNSDNNLSTDNNFSDSNKRLPNTGESLIGQLSMILAGLLIVIGIFVFLVRRRKQDKD